MSFSYDLDGSMTYRPVDATSGWMQIWNGEDRLASATRRTTRLEFRYDYMGRRFEKKVYENNTLTRHQLFVYDGFKCVEELDGLNGNAVTMRHAWQPFDVGLDVILATTEGDGMSYFLHDANKNVMQRALGSGIIAEAHIYAPFGNSNETFAAHIGFSSEMSEEKINLAYYNFRFYYFRLGRWNNRDPIDEQGGINIYSFATNVPVSKSDHLGRNVYEYTMSKCEIAIFYGHHYFSGKQHGIQSVKIIPSVCSYYALLGCSTGSLKNNTPLPGFNPPDDMVGWYKDKDGSKGLSGYIDDAKKAAIKASMALKRCPCNCRIVKFNVIRVDKKRDMVNSGSFI